MHQHQHDENNAPNQADDAKPTDLDAHHARGPREAQSPLEDRGAHRSRRHRTAAGFYSIYETGHYGFKEMGVIARTSKSSLNTQSKKPDSTRPSAWPDPDGKRKTAEFCENGAKAVAWEATTKRLTPEIFAQHMYPRTAPPGTTATSEELGRITHPMLRRKNSDHLRTDRLGLLAFQLIADELHALASPNEASSTPPGHASNEAAFLYGLFGFDNSAPTTSPIAPTCAMNPAAPALPKSSASEKPRSESTISPMPMPFS